MDLKLSDEEKLLQSTAAQFVKRELLAREGQYLKQQELFLPPGDPTRRQLDPVLRRELVASAQQVGLWALDLPESAGGSALGALGRVLIYREFGRTVVPFGPAIIPSVLAKSEYAKDLLSDTMTLSVGFDQLNKSGSLDGITSRYRPMSDGYAISRTEIDIYQPTAELFLFPAREEGTNRIGIFLLEKKLSGVSITEEIDLNHDATVARLVLHDVRVPEAGLLGYEYEAAEIIAAEQLRIAARCLGMAMRCLADSIEHARNRVTFGRPLAQRQAVQWMLADLSVDLRTCTWLTLDAAWRADQSLPYFDAAALAKKRAARMAFKAADTAIQIHGGYGVCKEFPFEGFYRETRMLRLLYGREEELDRALGQRFLSEGSVS